MKLFKFLKKSNHTNIPQEEVISTPDGAVAMEGDKTNSTASTTDTHAEEVVTITYGTGMPIDVIYAYIGKDYEPEGYQDALVNSSVEYCKAKENIIINKLRQLFKQVSLTYNGEIRNLIVQIENSKALFNLTSAAMLEAKKETCEEHIAEINQMIEQLNAKSPDMMIMIDSYRRGFSKGVSAQTASFLSSTPVKP